MKLFLTLLSLLTGVASPAPIYTPAGPVAGVRQGDVISYKGIPYALPPVGSRRWAAPQPVPPWRPVLQADHFRSDCMQRPFKYDAAPLRTEPSEDCLYLNIWTPAARSAAKRPVMVWIHGGGFVNGGSSPAIYDGSAFARSGVILVSLNYRLGRFGYFAFPGLAAANYGLLDQIAALKWVHDNIEAFGGDPDRVTLFGESAGGMSVHLLMMSGEARGLFGKAIVESGGGRKLLGGMETLIEAEAFGANFASRSGIAPANPKAVEKLRALPAEAVLDDLNLATLLDRHDFSGPIIDGVHIRSQVGAAYDAGQVAHIPLLIGTNDSDGIFDGDLDAAYALAPGHRAEAETLYDPAKTADAHRIGTALWADLMMLEPARNVARQVSAQGQPVYDYRFAYVPAAQRATLSGAPHASEIPFVFKTLEATLGAKTSPDDLDEATLIHAYWVGFATTGHPSAPTQIRWPAYDPGRDKLMIFDSKGGSFRPDPFRARLDFAESLNTSQ